MTMDELLKLGVQSSGAAIVALIAFYYGNKAQISFMHTLDSVQSRFNNTVDNHLQKATEAQREESKAKIELSLKLQELAIANKEAKEITERLYKELIKVKKPKLYQKVINIE